jgi:hypothetical protein
MPCQSRTDNRYSSWNYHIYCFECINGRAKAQQTHTKQQPFMNDCSFSDRCVIDDMRSYTKICIHSGKYRDDQWWLEFPKWRPISDRRNLLTFFGWLKGFLLWFLLISISVLIPQLILGGLGWFWWIDFVVSVKLFSILRSHLIF